MVRERQPQPWMTYWHGSGSVCDVLNERYGMNHFHPLRASSARLLHSRI